jgi:hypothetical protein
MRHLITTTVPVALCPRRSARKPSKPTKFLMDSASLLLVTSGASAGSSTPQGKNPRLGAQKFRLIRDQLDKVGHSHPEEESVNSLERR